MIEPYATVTDSFLIAFSKIGFSKSQESDYSMTFSDGRNFVEISTEKYYHPSFNAVFVDENGTRFSLWIVRDILAPDQHSKDSNELNAIKKQYHLDDVGTAKSTRAKGITAYVQLSMVHLFFSCRLIEKN